MDTHTDGNVKTSRVMVLQVGLYLRDNVSIMSSVEHRMKQILSKIYQHSALVQHENMHLLESSQKMAGLPVARARLTAKRTQSLIGASLVWHIRQISPAPTSWVKMTLPTHKKRKDSQINGMLRIDCTNYMKEEKNNYKNNKRKRFTIVVSDLHGTISRNLEGLIVRTILLSLLSH